jgi:hypothetical protein
MGLSVDQIADVAEANAEPSPERTARQDRNRRYYEKRLKASEKRLIKTPPSPKDSSVSLSEKPSLDQNPIRKETPLSGGQRKAVLLGKPNDFDRFWEAYPHKVGKRAAETAFQRALKRSDLASILTGLQRAQLSRSWADGFIPHPTTWLNQDRWLDEPDDRARAPPALSFAAQDMLLEAEGRRLFNQEMEAKYGRANGSDDRPGDRGAVIALPAPAARAGRSSTLAR